MRVARVIGTVVVATVIAGAGCTPGFRSATPSAAPTPAPCTDHGPSEYRPDPAQAERDRIFSLLTYAIVAKTWQPWEPRRGYNIGAILVDASDKILCWAVNSIEAADDGTQHAETRLMTNYLQVTKGTKLEGLRVYTTLEPCAMCSGMMVLQKVGRVVYGQTDPGFGKALERLALDSSRSGGYCPYPRAVQSVPAADPTRAALDQAFAGSGSSNIVEWLASSAAEQIYRDAAATLQHLAVAHPENESVLRRALAFYEGVPTRYTATPYSALCGVRGR